MNKQPDKPLQLFRTNSQTPHIPPTTIPRPLSDVSQDRKQIRTVRETTYKIKDQSLKNDGTGLIDHWFDFLKISEALNERCIAVARPASKILVPGIEGQGRSNLERGSANKTLCRIDYSLLPCDEKDRSRLPTDHHQMPATIFSTNGD
ncbi:hypothetical protein E8F20_19790 [Pseudomonas sp. BN415]|uniref:hypothetical protein n=1 Tax=Pseudomonas sp. BN415 TaxID=2567889 RepID=UPI002458C1CF|nr:hypothetical protein [Pseudomonas sp. BN415]MDH4584107.1 hypothetical protein [Pseudomonas sp. BN415]